MRNSRHPAILASLSLAVMMGGCGTVTVRPPVVEHYGVPIYQFGSGIPDNPSPEEAALIRGRVTMEELRRNELGDQWNLNSRMDDYSYPPP